MRHTLRIADSGLCSARRNLSLTEALCRRRQEDGTPDTLRFQHFPRSAIIGRHQRLEKELNLEWIAANGVETARRMTGGGAIVMGPGILGWELIIARDRAPRDLEAVSGLACNGVARALRSFGIDAAFRPRNDIEVDGRKISGTGGYFDGTVLVFQGTVLVELDRDFLAKALVLPAHKLGKRGLKSFNERICDLRDVMGSCTPALKELGDGIAEGICDQFGFEPLTGEISEWELSLAALVHDEEIGTDSFVRGTLDSLAAPGRSCVVRDLSGGRVEIALTFLNGLEAIADQILITGDFFVTPPRVIPDLEAHLRGIAARNLEAATIAFLSSRSAKFLGIDANEIAKSVGEAASIRGAGTKNG